jgi:hypothetical protein
MDRILMVLALPLVPFLGFSSAVAISGYVLGPSLEVLAIGLLIFGGSAILRKGLPFVGVLAACQLWLVFAFFYVRPDHHGLQATLFAGFLAFAIRAVTNDSRGFSDHAVGFFAGMAVWVSTEALVVLFPLLGVLAAIWVLRGQAERAVMNRRIMISAAAVLALALLIDGPPPDRWSPDFDRFSVVHLSLFALLSGLWVVLERVPARSWSRRLGALTLGAIFVAGTMVILYPGVQAGPMARVPPELWTLWLDRTSEFLPLLGTDQPMLAAVSIVRLLPALAIAAYLASRGPTENRWAWALVAVGLAWFGILATIVQARWAYYLHVLYPLPLAWALGVLVERCQRFSSRLVGAGLISLAIFVFAFGPALGTALAFGGGEQDQEPAMECAARDVVPELKTLPREGGAADIILAPVFWGPELLYRTDLSVVATPYHRNVDGILDSYRIMVSSPDSALNLIDRRGIRWIAVCQGEDWTPLVRPEEEGSLYRALQQGENIPSLEPVALPDSLAEHFGLWKVTSPAGADSLSVD